MKKHLLIILLLACSGSIGAAFAQSFPPDSVRRMLKHFLFDIKETRYPEDYGEFGLTVRDLLSDQNLGSVVREYPYFSTPDIRAILNGDGAGMATPQYGIYAFHGAQIPSGEHVVIKHGDKWITIKMYDWYNHWGYLDVIQELTNYFQDYPEAPRILIPIYNEAIIKIWNDNLNIPME